MVLKMTAKRQLVGLGPRALLDSKTSPGMRVGELCHRSHWNLPVFSQRVGTELPHPAYSPLPIHPAVYRVISKRTHPLSGDVCPNLTSSLTGSKNQQLQASKEDEIQTSWWIPFIIQRKGLSQPPLWLKSGAIPGLSEERWGYWLHKPGLWCIFNT